ncbi:MAG: AbiU2 domain-containing protein [Promethearchaeota archaeon]
MVNICDCDVQDKEALAIFRAKRVNWNNWLFEDPLSISKQIMYMLWKDAIFRTFNEARRLTINRESESLGFNGPLLHLLDEGFLDSQVMAIRRLTDRNFYDPKKGVLSVPRLTDDMSINIDIFTRENYVSYDGSKYEGLSLETDGIDKWIPWKNKHENFDTLSNVSPQNRSRADRVNKSVFIRLNKELKICENLRTYANKFIAHASDPIGRLKLTENQKKVTLDKLEQCYKAIIRVSSFIGVIVLYGHTLGGVPTPQYNHLKNIEKPMVSQDDLENLYNYWLKRKNEVSHWNENLWAIL